jgi:phospholipid/cholesterol/gamma-HCH transport system substrate-binding protein
MRRRGGGLAGSPILIGGVTVLVIVLAVFLSYNANSGLPFVPAYRVHADVPSAANLVVGNDVRIGGTRVGAVKGIAPQQLDDGRIVARLDLQLDRDVGPLPQDSTLLVRSRSALGLKYVQITRGTSARTWPEGATIPLRAATPQPVELDEFLNMFDARTRRAAQRNLQGFGTALAGRGGDVNDAIGAFRPMLLRLAPAMRVLAAPRTHLARLARELGVAAAAVAPVAEEQAGLFTGLDRTMGALRAVARPYLQDSITEGRPALDAAIRELPRQRPFLRRTSALFRELRPGARALRGAAPSLAGALTAGTPALRRAPALNRRLTDLLDTVRRFSQDVMVPRGLRATTGAADALAPTLRFVTPAQTRCNYVTLFFRNAASLLSQGDRNGTWQRFIIVATPTGPNSEGGPASAPANGPTVENHLHSNPYPNTAAPGQPVECEAGNEPYPAGRTVVGNVPGTQAARTSGSGG